MAAGILRLFVDRPCAICAGEVLGVVGSVLAHRFAGGLVRHPRVLSALRLEILTATGTEHAVAVVCAVRRAGVDVAARAAAIRGPSVLVAELALVAGDSCLGGRGDEEGEEGGEEERGGGHVGERPWELLGNVVVIPVKSDDFRITLGTGYR